jgi:hypothetical protein
MTHLRRQPKHLEIEERRIYHAELDSCPGCGGPLDLCGYYDSRKTVQQLDKVVYVASRPKVCRNTECSWVGKPQPAAAAQTVALWYSTYGLDVVAQIGWWRDREHLDSAEIHRRLQARIQIGRREVDLLYHQYQLLLACTEAQQPARVAQVVAEYGGLLLHVDGLEPEGAQEQLWVVRELLSGCVLAAAWLPRVTVATLQQLLTPVKDYLAARAWPVRATLSDKQGVLVEALQTVWPQAPHQWCQSHYLRNAAEPLYAHDLALKTDLRRDVRRSIRRSLSQVAAAAAVGDFAPQLVTGLVVTDAAAAAAPAGAPAGRAAPRTPTSTAADAPPPTPSPAPCPRADSAVTPAAAPPPAVHAAAPPAPPALLLMARSPTLAAARPVETEGQARVIQGYARVLQQALAREGRAPWFLAGLAVYADLAALRDSLARCLRVNDNARLRLWQLTLTQQTQAYAAAFAVVRQAQAWLDALRQTLDAIPLPSPQLPGAGSTAAARQVAATLGQIADQTVTDPWLGAFRHDLLAISERYWAGLFVCYDIVGLPRTNNALESLFGQTKRQTRRQTGLRQIRQPLQRHGAWLIYQGHDATVTELHNRLAHVPRQVYHAERTRWLARQAHFQHRYRWRHQRTAVLAELETAWTTANS